MFYRIKKNNSKNNNNKKKKKSKIISLPTDKAK